jgi:4-alpha-glucanotransferase
VDERPNQPGTVDQWPNWSIALPVPLEDIEVDPRVQAVADTMRQARPSDGG